LTALKARTLPHGIRRDWRSTSFSALVRDDAEVDARDHDARSAAVAASGEAVADESPELPRGARFGIMVHAILEEMDFAADAQGVRAEVERRLAGYGYSPNLAEPLTVALKRVLETPMAPDKWMLAQVDRRHRLDELEFHLSLREGAPPLVAGDLAAVFESRSSAPYGREYVDRLASLSFAEVRGYLHGFVDLVCQVDGRFYLIDYKSNDLGRSLAAYQPDELAREMERHHYFLQYHLYLVALHRYLQQRIADYDYERHLGGVRYLFLRGMGSEHPSGSGIFADRPPLAVVEHLAKRLIEGRGA
jgi:exodeoxyribonuclease V beta subunit